MPKSTGLFSDILSVVFAIPRGSGDVHQLLVKFSLLGAEWNDGRVARTIVDGSGAGVIDGVFQMIEGVSLLQLAAYIFVFFSFHTWILSIVCRRGLNVFFPVFGKEYP